MAGTNAQWVVGMTLSGCVREFNPAGDFELVAGDVLVQKADNCNHWKVPDSGAPWKVVFFVFDPWSGIRPLLTLPEIRPGFLKVSLSSSTVMNSVRQALLKAHRLLHSHWPNRLELARNALEEALLWCQTEADRGGPNVDPRVEHVMNYLANHATTPVCLADLADVASLSVPRLMTLFRDYTGTTPMRYLETQRMARARELLVMTSHSVKEISDILGYSDAAYFSKRFTRYFQTPPGAYRKGNRGSD